MEQNPRVSIIMNCYNSSKYLKEAIDSVYAQTFTDWEIIFWDNASNDGNASAEIAKSYDSKLKYFKGEKTVPLGAARNLALNQARGKYIAFLDCDDMWLPEKLKKQTEILEHNDDIDFIYSNFKIINYLLKDETPQIAYRKSQPQGHIFKEMLANYSIGILTVILRKSALNKLKELFEEKLSYAEEFDLFIRLLHGSRAAYLNEPLAVYRMHREMSTIDGIENQFNEVLYCLNKFDQIEENFKQKYKKEIEEYKKKASIFAGIMLLMKDKPEIANKYLNNYKFKDLKALIYYLLAKLPNRLRNILWNMLRKIRRWIVI